MGLNINKLDEVWTSDHRKLGLAQCLFHRTEEIDPQVEYYASYLEVESYEYGSAYFVPTDFIAGRDSETDRIMLKVTFQSVLDQAWSRMPDFVVHKQGRKEDLAH